MHPRKCYLDESIKHICTHEHSQWDNSINSQDLSGRELKLPFLKYMCKRIKNELRVWVMYTLIKDHLCVWNLYFVNLWNSSFKFDFLKINCLFLTLNIIEVHIIALVFEAIKVIILSRDCNTNKQWTQMQFSWKTNIISKQYYNS